MEHDYRTVTGSELLEARKAAGASRTSVALAMGKDPATLWRWEKPDRIHGHIQAAEYTDALARVVAAKGATS